MTPLPDPGALGALRDAGIEQPLAERLAIYAALVLAANRRLNLTGAKDGKAFAAHIVDALTLAADIGPGGGPLIDVGSGNGVPGIPLALATGVRVTLLEPIKKRAVFLARALTELGLEGEAVAARAEDSARDPVYRERFNVATARAVAAAPTVAELTVPFLAVGGRALLQRGALETPERNAVADAALVLGAELVEERPLQGERRILVLKKRSATSPRFPRKNGIPAKRPLCV
ncbi:MAG TPA: 16S rRNA (guanine(527)-N(7))-methyltransferase RsmG [Candidatus Elarobacter sp.]|nr:16S rRNA (guanine(527)-N(7))-methyltransferase RsmG [Candidatus Elarobacter sp.]HEV2739399.1 16S rRNA (guanine(527)-N(7))-methyltransferase RsmG [Candidatus Elarobacter sp.]